MQVLVFDCALDKTYITLALQNNITNVATFVSKKIRSSKDVYHSVYLVQQIKEILNENIIDMQNLDGIGVNIGPGSFTGIRISMTIAKTLAQQLDTKLVGINSMDILSKVYIKNKILSPVVMDAKRSMYYVFNPDTDTKPILYKANEMKEFLDKIDSKRAIICDNSSLNFISEFGKNAVSYEKENFELGEILAGITLTRLKNAKRLSECHWSVVKPLYIQTPPVLS